MDKIEQIDIAAVRLPLQAPVQLGATTLVHRDYVIVKLRLSNGVDGFGYGFDRGLPLVDLCLTAARSYLGEQASDRNRLRKLALGPTPAPRAAMTRGASLCDIALWDGWCRSVGQPLWSVLGGVRDSVPVMPIIGYGMSPEVAARETAKLAADGYTIIKCMIDGLDFEKDDALMRAVAQALPPDARFGIDAHWSWRTVADALPWCRLAESLRAAFVEDPFAPTQVHAIGELARRVDVPLAVGEDVIDIHGFRDLAATGGILRVDASVSGGVIGAMEAIGLARAFSREVIPHVVAPLHMHLGIASDVVQCVEVITQSVAADPIDRFFLNPPAIEGGRMVRSDLPGAGLALDWAGLQPFLMRCETLTL